MPNTLKSVSFTAPPQYQSELSALERRRRLAEALQAEGQTPISPNRMAGGYVVPISRMEGLAQLGKALSGGYMARKTDERERELSQQMSSERSQKLAEALRQGMGEPEIPQPAPELGGGPGRPAIPGNPLQAYGTLMQTADPLLMQVGGNLLNYQQRQQEGSENRATRMEGLAMQLEAKAQDRAASEAERAQARAEAAQLRRELQKNQQDFAAQMATQNQTFAKSMAEEARLNRPEKPLSEGQGRAATFGTRAALSDRVLNDLEEKINVPALSTKQAIQKIPLIGGILGAAGNTMLSSDQQRVEQAQRDFVNATLRQESGAVISDQEFDNAKKQYFPQPGDGPEVIKQKRMNRQTVISGFKRQAGPAGVDIESAVTDVPALSKSPANPQRRSEDVLKEADRILNGQR